MVGRIIFAIVLLSYISYSLRTFTSPAELVDCIIKCEKPVTACMKFKDKCVKPYNKCIDGNDTYNCLITSKIKELQHIGKCFDEQCEAYIPE